MRRLMTLSSPLLAAALALTAPAAAQITATHTAQTDIVASSYYQSQITQTIPQGTNLMPSANVTASATVASSSVSVGYVDEPNRKLMYLTTTGSGRYLSSSFFAFSNTGGTTRLVLTSPTPVQAKLVINWTGTFIQGAYANVQIDYTGDGQPDFGTQATASHEVDVTVGPQGLPIETTIRGYAPGNSRNSASRFTGQLTVALVPKPVCDLLSYGQGCGPTLAAGFTFGGELTVDLSGASPGPAGVGVLILGVQRAVLPLPAGCSILTFPIVGVPLTVDPGGSAGVVLPLPASRPVLVNLQAGSLDTASGAITTSQAIEVLCR